MSSGRRKNVDVATIRSIHRYDAWANEKTLDCCEQLSDEQFTQGEDTPWGSIRNQLVHQLNVQKSWLSWADGSMSGEDAYALQFDPADFPDVAAVRAEWETIRRQTAAFLDRLTPDVLATPLTVEMPGADFSMTTGKLMLHIALHSMQHRTEANVALTGYDASPGDVDYLFFALEQSGTPDS
jgi:uncharacterized damage-inducible protein DinB